LNYFSQALNSMIEALLSADHVEIQFDIPASVINALL